MESEIKLPLNPRKNMIAIGLIVLGVILLLIVFALGYSAFRSYNLEINVDTQDTTAILGISAQVLINLLVKIAFLGISLAAGSVILSKGIELLKECPAERRK